MNLSLKLLLFRENLGFEEEDISERLGVSLRTYQELENGRGKMNGHIAQGLSEIYKVPWELFIMDDTPHYFQADVIYNNCSFSGGGSNGYINNHCGEQQLNETLKEKDNEIKTLKLQLEELSALNKTKKS